MENKQRSDRHANKKKFKNVVKVNFTNKKKEKDVAERKLKILKKDINIKKPAKLKLTKGKQKKALPIIETDEQFAKFVTKLSKGKKISKNMAEVVGSISNFNDLTQRYLETIVALTNSSKEADLQAINALREQSNALLKHLNDNAEILTPEERIQIIQRSAEITSEISEVHKRGKIIIEKAMNLASGALLITATILFAFLQNQGGNDNDRDTIDMDD